jgi:hypothetical protein
MKRALLYSECCNPIRFSDRNSEMHKTWRHSEQSTGRSLTLSTPSLQTTCSLSRTPVASYSVIGKAAAARYGQPFTSDGQLEAYNDSQHRMHLPSEPHLVTRLKMNGALPLLPLYVFMAKTTTNLHF